MLTKEIQRKVEYFHKKRDFRQLNELYLVDAKGRLLDDIKIRELLLHPLETKIEELHKQRQIILHADESVHRAATLFRKYNRTVLPVVDAERQLLGVLTVNDFLHITDFFTTNTEDTEDIFLFAHRETAMGKKNLCLWQYYHCLIELRFYLCASIDTFRLPSSPGKPKIKHPCALCASVVRSN